MRKAGKPKSAVTTAGGPIDNTKAGKESLNHFNSFQFAAGWVAGRIITIVSLPFNGALTCGFKFCDRSEICFILLFQTCSGTRETNKSVTCQETIKKSF
jgi:hypothetical protein